MDKKGERASQAEQTVCAKAGRLESALSLWNLGRGLAGLEPAMKLEKNMASLEF